jgi:carbon monoxide dehydrogenase subunit G
LPEVVYSTEIQLPRGVVWDFVKDMNHWAPFLTGYQGHTVENERDSVWTLKGDVGVLSRVVQFKAHVEEWAGPERVRFSLVGITEIMEGGGQLVMTEVDTSTVAGARSVATGGTPAKPGLFARIASWFARVLFRRMHGAGPERQLSKNKAAGGPVCKLEFTLRMDAGGPMGPMVNAMLGPALLPAAEDLANKIAAHLEKVHASL